LILLNSTDIGGKFGRRTPGLFHFFILFLQEAEVINLSIVTTCQIIIREFSDNKRSSYRKENVNKKYFLMRLSSSSTNTKPSKLVTGTCRVPDQLDFSTDSGNRS
jgi:hypothetical protein